MRMSDWSSDVCSSDLKFIGWLRLKQGKGQPIREDGPASHLITKKGTPTMGGLMILAAMTLSTLLWMDFSNRYTWACLFVTLGFGLIGFLDDYDKVTKRSHKGVWRPEERGGGKGCVRSCKSRWTAEQTQAKKPQRRMQTP